MKIVKVELSKAQAEAINLRVHGRTAVATVNGEKFFAFRGDVAFWVGRKETAEKSGDNCLLIANRCFYVAIARAIKLGLEASNND
jgi:hypothetical protein